MFLFSTFKSLFHVSTCTKMHYLSCMLQFVPEDFSFSNRDDLVCDLIATKKPVSKNYALDNEATQLFK